MNELIRDAIAAGLGTGLAELLTVPACTIKTQYQTNNCGSSILQVVRATYARHGIMGFCRSGMPAMSGQVMTTVGKYTLYNKLKELSPNTLILNGVVSGLTVSTALQPIDFIRIALQRNVPLAQVLWGTGLAGFYRGYSKTLLKSGISSAFFYPLCDTLKATLPGDNIVVASGLTAIISTIGMHPFDYIKTRHIAGESWKSPTLSGYSKGLSLNLLRTVPHFMITMTCIDFIKARILYLCIFIG